MPQSQPDFRAAKTATAAVYDRQANAWHETRDQSLYEADWLNRALTALPVPADILDVGCGSGRPLAGFFLDAGHRFTGIDSSPQMLSIAKEHYPQAIFHCMDIRALTLANRFDLVLSWDGFFHLSPDEQRAALPSLADLVREGGAMLLTIGTGEGEVTGTVNGETVYHASLSASEYTKLTQTAGFTDIMVVHEDATAWGRSLLLARNKTNCERP